MILVVYKVYNNVLCHNIPQGTGGICGVIQRFMLHPQGTGGVYGVLHRSMLHLPGYWWYKWTCTIAEALYC